MEQQLLRLNIQFFAEGDDDDFWDLDKEIEEFENEWEDQDEESDEEVHTDDDNESEDDLDSDMDEEEEPGQEEPGNQIHSDDEVKRNAAFAQLRREAEANKRYAATMQKMADVAGVPVEDLIKRFEEKQLEDEAVERKVPVDFLKEHRATQERLTALEEKQLNDRRDAELELVKTKYEAKDDEIIAAIQFAQSQGIDLRTSQISFEQVYKLAHMDKLMEQASKQSQQAALENKKKRQESAALPTGTGVSQQSDDITDEFVDEMLEKFGIRI